MIKLLLFSFLFIYNTEALKSSISRNIIFSKYDTIEASIRGLPNSYSKDLKRDVNLVMDIFIKSKQHSIPISLDTMTSEIWLISNDCKSSFCDKKNANGIEGGKGTKVTIQGGNVRGTGVQKEIKINSTSEYMTLNVIAADTVNHGIARTLDHQSYGVFGLGPSSQLATYLKPKMLTSLLVGPLHSKVIPTLYIDEFPFDKVNRNKDNIKMRISSLRTDQWRFRVNYISTYLEENNKWCNQACEAVLDIKHSWISGPPNDINSINSYLGADDNGEIGCYKIGLLEPLVFHIGGIDYKLSAENYIMKDEDSTGSKCYTVFKPMYSYNNEWKFGLAFLQQYLVAFDYSDNKMAFVPLKK